LFCQEVGKTLVGKNSNDVGRTLIFYLPLVLIAGGIRNCPPVPVQGVTVGALPHATLECSTPMIVGGLRAVGVFRFWAVL